MQIRSIYIIYGHLTSKVASPLRSPFLRVRSQIIPLCEKEYAVSLGNIVTSLLMSLMASPVGGRNVEVLL